MTQLQEIVRLVDAVLGPARIGVYLHGSSVDGGLRPASDVDVLVVSDRSLDAAQRRALVDGLFPLSGAAAGARPVELTVVVQDRIRPWRYPPTCDFLYGDWMREEFAAGALPEPTPDPGLALVVTLALAGDRALAGPPPAQVLDPVPRADLVRASLDGIPNLLDDLAGGDTRNVVLTLARIWYTVGTGEVTSKDAAAAWALPRLPREHRPVLEHARDLYLTRRYSEETWTDDLLAQVKPTVDALLTEIRRRSAPAS